MQRNRVAAAMAHTTMETESRGAGATFAPGWFETQFETIKSRVSFVPGIKVVRGATQVIVPRHESHLPNGSVFRYNNGDIQVHDRRSSDGGQTWRQVEHILEPSTFQFPEPDGEVLMFRQEKHDWPKEMQETPGIRAAGRPEVTLRPTRDPDVREATTCRSRDQGLTRAESAAAIHLPEWLRDCPLYLCRKIVGLADSSLLMTLYGLPPSGPATDHKSYAIRSTDRGATWRFLATVTAGNPPPLRSEGFCEPTLLALPDGRVQCFLRSGASYQASLGSHDGGDKNATMPFAYNPQTPIYLCESGDGGCTWSQPAPVAPFGVWPDAVQLRNGVIAAVYGRPGDWLMVSGDEGRRWGPILQFYNDLYPPDGGNYCALAEVAPNVLLVVYARTDPNDHLRSEIVGTYFRVTRSAGEAPVAPESLA